MIYNGTSERISFQITVTDPGSRYRGQHSPSATKADDSTLEETPTTVFEDSVTLDGEQFEIYDNIELNSGGNKITVTIEDDREKSYDIDSHHLSQTSQLTIGIYPDAINFGIAAAECGE